LAELQLTRSRQLLDSIHYARRIQRALLQTSDQELSQALPRHRIRWEPRDTVGGDYYFCRSAGARVLVVVLDCTGHGVPGALMTMIVTASLEAAVAETPSLQPAAILNSVNRRIRQALGQKGPPTGIASATPSDGMDAAVLLLDGDAGELQFSGASIPLFMRLPGDSGWICLPAARGGVGYPEIADSTEWPTSRHRITPGLRFAMATDGLLDQIGGPQRIAYGRKRLLAALTAGQQLPLEEQFTHTWLQLEEWQGREAQRDDMTLLMAEVSDDFFPVRCR
jgi:serine phosphatase RsbU (regulator of sigma subunit)